VLRRFATISGLLILSIAARRRKMRLRIAGAVGFKPVGLILP
jgi:hypothetical protein